MEHLEQEKIHSQKAFGVSCGPNFKHLDSLKQSLVQIETVLVNRPNAT